MGGANTIAPLKASLLSGHTAIPVENIRSIMPTATSDPAQTSELATTSDPTAMLEAAETTTTPGTTENVCHDRPLDIPDSKFKASSSAIGYEAYFARLDHFKSWMNNRYDYNSWLQVDLGQVHMVNRLVTQGGGGYWVEQFMVMVAVPGSSVLNYIQSESGNKPKVFNANVNGHSTAENWLGTVTKLIRIYPTFCEPPPHYDDQVKCSLRIEIRGCTLVL